MLKTTTKAFKETASGNIRFWLLAAATATVAGLAMGIGYFSAGGVFGPLSDATTPMIGGSLIPVALWLHRRLKPAAPRLSTLAVGIGLVGLTLLSLGGLLLLLFDLTGDLFRSDLALGSQFLGIFVQGVWLVLVGVLKLRSDDFSSGLGWASIVGGGGYMLFGIGSPFGSDGPIAMTGAMIGFVGFLTWALWTRAALRQKAPSPALAGN